MSSKTKKTLIIIVSTLTAIAIVFAIYWKATEHDRYVKSSIDRITTQITDYHSGERSRFFFYSSELRDSTIIDFISTQVSEMIENEEYRMLTDFLYALEYENAYIPEIREKIANSFINANNLETAFKMKDNFEYYLDYYNAQMSLSRDSALIVSYIESNGVNKITTTPGTGFYANETDYTSKERVGLSTSPLYDAKSVTYMGDFKMTHSYGVRLNSYYEETYYSSTCYHFRDNYIDFSPDDGECIYSGEYLFCFSQDGELIGAEKISKK